MGQKQQYELNCAEKTVLNALVQYQDQLAVRERYALLQSGFITPHAFIAWGQQYVNSMQK